MFIVEFWKFNFSPNLSLKMIKSLILNLLFFGTGFAASFAQDSTVTQNSLRSGTITSQFDYIYSVSNNFQDHEVVQKTNLEQLKANVLDSIRTMSKEVSALKLQMTSMGDSVQIMKNLLSAEIEEKNQAIADRDNFNLMGIGIQKSAYSSMMWALVLVMAGALSFFAVQYFRSSGKISKAEKDLVELQEEFEQHRKNTLERERKLKRELIDAQMRRS